MQNAKCGYIIFWKALYTPLASPSLRGISHTIHIDRGVSMQKCFASKGVFLKSL